MQATPVAASRRSVAGCDDTALEMIRSGEGKQAKKVGRYRCTATISRWAA